MSGRGRDRMAGMADLAAMMRDRELAKVERIMTHIARLEADVATIRAARAAREGDGALDAARLSGADVAWTAWTDAELRTKEAQIAQLRVTHRDALAAARRAFGRSDVLSRLSEASKKG